MLLLEDQVAGVGEALEAAYGTRADEIAAQLATHFERAHEPAAALRNLIAAGLRARRRFASREAIAYLESALTWIGLLHDAGERRRQEVEVRLALGRALSDVYGFGAEPVRENYERVSELCADAEDSARFFEALYARWYLHALRAEQRWGVRVPVLMAVLHQESRFRARARPDWRFGLGVIPLGPASSAYGYGQVKKGTWDDYQRQARRPGARRDRFDDVVDFVGWYGDVIARVAGVSKEDAFHLYLAYHEGPSGFQRRSFEAKPWLLGVARKVQDRAVLYGLQHDQCRGPMMAAAPAG